MPIHYKVFNKGGNSFNWKDKYLFFILMEFQLENDEENLEIASKTWNRVIDSASKVGYREGIKDGSMSVFQEGFDRGYKDAFKTTFLIGTYNGISRFFLKDMKHPTEVENILSKTKKGICYFCEKETKGTTDASDKSINEIQNCQKQHSDEILKIVQNYFNPILKQHNFSFDSLNLYT